MDASTSGWDRKKDRIMVVTFNPADKTFELSCDSTTMQRAGNILLQRDVDNAPWTFVSINNLPDPPFKSTVAADGTSIAITNDHSKIDNYWFTVTVWYDGNPYTSPDTRFTNPPMIRNL